MKEKPIIHKSFKHFSNIEAVAETAKLIILYSAYFELRKNPSRQGKEIYHSEFIKDVLDNDYFKDKPLKYIYHDEFEAVINKFKLKENLILCYSYCNHFDYCDKKQCLY